MPVMALINKGRITINVSNYDMSRNSWKHVWMEINGEKVVHLHVSMYFVSDVSDSTNRIEVPIDRAENSILTTFEPSLKAAAKYLAQIILERTNDQTTT